jgi:hypothetical protein
MQDPALTEQSPEWEVSGTAIYSDPPGSEDRLTLIGYADKGSLHLEARYNYEDLETFSLFVGWNFETGEELEASFTPMFGVVGGETDGVAPGLEVELGWKRLAWYAEMEYLFDLDDSDDNYFYSWSTLTYGLTEEFRAGLVAERTKIVDTDMSVQFGLALEYDHAPIGVSLYAYNVGSDDDSYAAVAFEFAP